MVEQTQVYDFSSPAARANPQAVYALMREEDPVHRTVGPQTGNAVWILTRYDDCVAMLKDPRVGKDVYRNLPREEAQRWRADPESDDPWVMIDQHLLNIDPPDHTRLRALVHKAFTPRMVEDLRPRIQTIAHDLLDQMSGSTEADLIEQFSFPLPITVIAEMLGIPAADRDQFRKWTKILLFSADQDDNRAALMEFGMYMNQMIDERQANPQGDIISALVQAEENGDTLNRIELLSMLFLLLVAGHETTVNLIGNGTLALIQHPEQMRKLRDDRGLMRPAVEEILRYNGPVDLTTIRWAFDDVEIGGKIIPRGEPVWASLLAANRDPAQFPEPDRFDITRDPNRHIAFGTGIHYCVGAPLARLEGSIAFNALLDRFSHIELACEVDDLAWGTDFLIIHGMNAMPVSYRT